MEKVVHIPAPCSENWDAMPQEARGRFCATCSTVVMDFTGWEPDAIATYLNDAAGRRICGRFDNNVVADTPEKTWLECVLTASVPLIRKIAAAVLFFFGSYAMAGCTMGAQASDHQDTSRSLPSKPDILLGAPAIITDTPLSNVQQRQTLGLVAPPNHDTIQRNTTTGVPTMGKPSPANIRGGAKPR